MLLCSFDYPPCDGGIARLCADLSAGWRRRGAAVHVVTQAAGTPGSAIPDLPETRLHLTRPRREWEAFLALRGRRGAGPLVCGTWYPEGLIAMLSGARRYVILAHGSELLPTASRWRRGLWRRLQRRVLRNAGLVAANSEYTRRLAERTAPGCRAVAIPLPVDHRRFTPDGRATAKESFGVAGRRVIGTVAHIQSYKGHDVVLDALASLPEVDREGYVYLVAGRGPALDGLKAKALALGIDHLVRWLGFVAEDDLPTLYRALDVFALCTREAGAGREVEGFGLVFLEAQACGTPVIGTRTGGIPDAIAEGDGGWLIGENDVDALADLLRRLARDPESFRVAGLAARARVERECTLDHYLNRFEAALDTAGVPMTDLGVTVVVPTLNRGGFLTDCLEDLAAQDYRPLEILVVDQSDADDPEVAQLVRQHEPMIVHHRVKFRGLPRARNHGWQHATHEAIVFVDDDIRCEPGFVAEHVRALRLPGVGLVAGGIDTPLGPEPARRRAGVYRRWTATPLRGFGSISEHDADHAPGCNFSAWRWALAAAGGLDEGLGRGAALYEETDLCLRVKRSGARVYFNGRARLLHLAAPGGGCRVDRVVDYVRTMAHNRGVMIRRHGAWYHEPVALARLAALALSYARHYREPKAFPAGLSESIAGLRAGSLPPCCTAVGRGSDL